MAASSITYWTRLEPRPRTASIARALRAEVRDPTWFLARQWQFGEFDGADSGSPSHVEMRTRTARIGSWRALGGVAQPLEAGEPLEAAMLREVVDGADMSLAVELAQTFETMLRENGIPENVIALYAPVYKLPEPKDAADRETERFLTAVSLRGWNGVWFHAAAAEAGGSPAEPPIPSAWQGPVEDVVNELLDWVRDTYGEIRASAPPDPPAWQRERLRYSGEVVASTKAASNSVFNVNPGPRGELDWYALDDERTEPATNTIVPPETRFVLPGNVRFRGMPNARFWDFEPSQTDFGAIEVDRRDLARMVATEFALTQSNDWFTVAVPLAPGSVVEVDWLLVHDVFGQTTVIRRANQEAVVAGAGRWNMFAPTLASGEASAAFVLPDMASQATERAPLEDVRFVRDELANMVWAIERTTPNGLGEARPRRDLESELADDRGPPASSNTDSPIRYIVQTEVPRNWIPMLPRATGGGQIEIVRGAMLETSIGTPSPLAARGRIVGAPTLALREEELLRSGTRVARCWQLSRRADGSTDLVLLRRRLTGAGEGNSGLRFDVAEPVQR